VTAINSKDGKSVRVARIQIFLHPFSSFPPLNATKKIAHTPTARTRSTIRVCILNTSFSTAFRPANLSAHTCSGSLRIGLSFRIPDPISRRPDHQIRQVQWPFRFLPCHAFQLPKFRNQNLASLRRAVALTRFWAGCLVYWLNLQCHSGVVSCINS
jgi:hypothetical protein